jgi:hypothetical protein
MKPTQAAAQRLWFEDSDPRLRDNDLGDFCYAAPPVLADYNPDARAAKPPVEPGCDDWIVQERYFSPFLDQERAAQIATLESFRTLEHGWDSYNAEPPSDTAIANARHILHVLWSSETAPPVRQVSPSVEGGVAIVFTGQQKKYADIECFNSGNILAITSDGTTEPSVWTLNGAGGNIRRAVEKLNAFFNG